MVFPQPAILARRPGFSGGAWVAPASLSGTIPFTGFRSVRTAASYVRLVNPLNLGWIDHSRDAPRLALAAAQHRSSDNDAQWLLRSTLHAVFGREHAVPVDQGGTTEVPPVRRRTVPYVAKRGHNRIIAVGTGVPPTIRGWIHPSAANTGTATDKPSFTAKTTACRQRAALRRRRFVFDPTSLLIRVPPPISASRWRTLPRYVIVGS
jgi:hypothetical protein